LTGKIFKMFLEAENQPSAMTLIVQKEVAERIVARKKKPLDSARGKESILSISVKVFGIPKYEFTVPKGAFRPAPKVDSAVLTIRDVSRKNFSSHEEEKRFFAIVRAGFAHKRKFVRKNLTDAGFPTWNIRDKARAENLSLNDWLALNKS
jgi:16S rRNA (adenine1518-N6/adenine1519-N6)-dimethyltransferase